VVDNDEGGRADETVLRAVGLDYYSTFPEFLSCRDDLMRSKRRLVGLTINCDDTVRAIPRYSCGLSEYCYNVHPTPSLPKALVTVSHLAEISTGAKL
jgi:hypothetical protein